jgi:KUP system potassium uptake protein
MNPSALDNTFYRLVPEWALWPMVGLATMATIIASQAMITGAYSVARQAIQLGLLPRMEIRHTHEEQEGQIYMPKINNILLVGVVFLCLVFGSSSALASAYGIAVIGTIAVGSVLAFIVLWKVKKVNPILAGLFILPFFIIELVFLVANLLKVPDGGIFPLAFAAFLVISMTIWVKGSKYLFKKAQRSSIPLSDLVEKVERDPPIEVPGTAIYLTSDPAYAPIAMLQNIKHNKILHEKNVVVSIITSSFPKVPDAQRVSTQPLSSNVTRVFINYGFMETPNLPRDLMLAVSMGLDADVDNASYFLGRRSIVPDPRRGLPLWQDNIYIAMLRSAAAATDFYRLPPDRVVELGIRMTI